MRKLLFLLVVFLLGCQIIPTPDEFPPPPTTVIVEFPQVTRTPAPELRPRPITQNDMLDARTFLLILKTQIAAGDDYGFAEKVRYPIQVILDGQKTTFSEPDELAKNIRAVWTQPLLDAITQTSEDDLILLPDGIRVGHGELWFNLFCTDAACTDTQFLITQINN